MRPKLGRAQIAAGLLCALLGFAAATQVRQVGQADFSDLRQDELIEVLDDLDSQVARLSKRNLELAAERDRLETSRTQGEAARQAAADRAAAQGILAGTLPAEGPGVILTVRDPDRKLTAAVAYLLVDELRNAGAEAIAVGPARITASSYFEAGEDGVLKVDGRELEAPYEWIAIGDPSTLQTALDIPGGALAAVRTQGGSSVVKAQDEVRITVVKTLAGAKFATAIE
jgi:uncharacterized protein YlxW (UPF0749 family)